jgi:hypothetical protein
LHPRSAIGLGRNTAEGGTFAVKWSALADSPQRLLQRDYSIKNGKTLSEAEIRGYYKGVRAITERA